ncbi:MAG: SRPBCC family protein [Chitinophagaceae bacterium]
MITVTTTVNTELEKVWNFFTNPQHIKNWNNASPDWHTPSAENDLQVGGEFNYTMAAKDGSFSFDFCGTYTVVIPLKEISYVLSDGRTVIIKFEQTKEGISIIESFDPENENSLELQQMGWQAILNNFKSYVEAN